MKKLLIIQKDEAYFLFETLQIIEKNRHHLKDFEFTILVDEKSLKSVYDSMNPLIQEITTDDNDVLINHYDLSINLSLNEKSWDFHSLVSTDKRIGSYRNNGQLFVDDLWSSYLLTLKDKAPFLTFQLQDIYRNILGFKSIKFPKIHKSNIRQIVLGTFSTNLFSANEQESLIYELSMGYPTFPLKDISEVDLISDLSHTLYIGPTSLAALKLCEAGGKGIFISSAFQGFNLLPGSGDHKFLSSRGNQIKASDVFSFVENELACKQSPATNFSVYSIEHEHIFGSYLKSHNQSDDNYPFYQSHLVLWNFLLNLFDTNLDIIECNKSQIGHLKTHKDILTKFIRLHDYAMVSIDTIYHESKSAKADAGVIQGHIKNLIEIETVSDQIAQSHSFLRPVLDFYRIRRGQNYGNTLVEQSQVSFLTYSEEHQALQALEELFSVTLKKNEVNI